MKHSLQGPSRISLSPINNDSLSDCTCSSNRNDVYLVDWLDLDYMNRHLLSPLLMTRGKRVKKVSHGATIYGDDGDEPSWKPGQDGFTSACLALLYINLQLCETIMSKLGRIRVSFKKRLLLTMKSIFFCESIDNKNTSWLSSYIAKGENQWWVD